MQIFNKIFGKHKVICEMSAEQNGKRLPAAVFEKFSFHQIQDVLICSWNAEVGQ